jgi:hypothetical protein
MGFARGTASAGGRIIGVGNERIDK